MTFNKEAYRLWKGPVQSVTGLFLLQLIWFIYHHISLIDAVTYASIFWTLMVFILVTIQRIQFKYHSTTIIDLPNLSIIILFSIGHFQFSSLLNNWLLTTSSLVAIHAVLGSMRGIATAGIVALIHGYWWVKKSEQQQDAIQQQLREQDQVLAEAELAHLHQQLQPHFLFNSLNSISSLTMIAPKEAQRMVILLGDFLRGTLRKNEQSLTTVEEELIQLERYLAIEEVRFGHRLNTIIECDPACRMAQLPAFILQPIIENAIKFGLYGQMDQFEIRIIISSLNGNLAIEVSNPFDADFVPDKPSSGFGLSSIQRRLYLLYKQNNLIRIERTNDIFTTHLQIPQT